MSTQSESIDHERFERLVKDGLANLYDLTALQTHSLTHLISLNTAGSQSRGEYLRDLILKAIDHLQPSEEEIHPGSPEWRPYLILSWRYVDGIPLAEIHERLALSGRQFRREHGRAVQAVATLLWDQIFPQQASNRILVKSNPLAILKPLSEEDSLAPEKLDEESQPQRDSFELQKSPLDPLKLLQGVINTLQQRAQTEGVTLNLLPCDPLPKVLTDRVILRQILISLISYAMEMTIGEMLNIGCMAQSSQIQVRLEVIGPTPSPMGELKGELLDKARYWAEKIDASIFIAHSEESKGSTHLLINVPCVLSPLLLAVDDHDIALRMYRRYSSQLNIRLVGLQDGSQVVEKARDLQPQVILLDVMIPNMDGWEVLQALRANPATSHIPVIICTVWEEPQLAFSLGAAGFLKKPFSQQEFLAMLARFGLA